MKLQLNRNTLKKKTLFRKKNFGGIMSPNLKKNYRALVIKTVEEEVYRLMETLNPLYI